MTWCEQTIVPAVQQAFDSSIRIEESEIGCKIILPLNRSDMDRISLWIKKSNNHPPEDALYTVTDLGETYALLSLSNVNISRNRQGNRINTIKKHYELDSAKYEVSLSCTQSELGHRILDAAQAIKSLSELTITRRKYSRTQFSEKVAELLDEFGYEYNTNVEVTATSGDYNVDFEIPNKPSGTYLETIYADDELSTFALVA